MVDEKVLRKLAGEMFTDYLNLVRGFNVDSFLTSGMDPFRFSFNYELYGPKDAVKKELVHKIEMKLENAFGSFHEKYLGQVEHTPSGTKWRIFKSGELPGIDIGNEGLDAYLQIKNKHNSMNSSSSKRLATELERVKTSKPGATVGCGWVIASPNRLCLGENYILPKARTFKGNELYEFVTGNPNEMSEALEMFREIIREYSTRHNFAELVEQAATRVKDTLESQAKSRGLDVIEYLYQNAVK